METLIEVLEQMWSITIFYGNTLGPTRGFGLFHVDEKSAIANGACSRIEMRFS